MSEPVLLAIIAALGSGGVLATLAKVVADARAGKHSRESDAEERLVSRLERRLDDYEAERQLLRDRVDRGEAYIVRLHTALVQAGIEIPPRT
jgi:hypothetical protein